MTNNAERKHDSNANRSSPKIFDGTGNNSAAKELGVELDENRRFGSNGAWAPQGGQQPDAPERDQDGTPRPATDEPTHLGRTQSTTNSQ